MMHMLVIVTDRPNFFKGIGFSEDLIYTGRKPIFTSSINRVSPKFSYSRMPSICDRPMF